MYEESLIRPEIDSTPCFKTLSAISKAFRNVIFSVETLFNFSLGITIRLSTFLRRLEIPFSAFFIFRLPSNIKGFVTIPTVSMPCSFATSATTGAAPVPVPPPIPAVTNTIWQPFKARRISSLLSSAALWPISGSAPAPLPFVSFAPS